VLGTWKNLKIWYWDKYTQTGRGVKTSPVRDRSKINFHHLFSPPNALGILKTECELILSRPLLPEDGLRVTDKNQHKKA